MRGKLCAMNDHAVSDSAHSVAVHFFRLVADYLNEQDLNAGELLDLVGLPRTLADHPEGRVPFAAFSMLCREAAQRLDEPAFGVHVGARASPGHLGSHGYALMSCATGAELLEQHARYSALTNDAGYSVIERRDGEIIRYWHSSLPQGQAFDPIQEDLLHASTVTLARAMVRRDDLNPNWVAFRHAAPQDVTAYESLFRCPIHFGSERSAMAVHAALAQLPLPHADPKLHRIMQDVCEQALQALDGANDPIWMQQARRRILESLQRGTVEIEEVATAAGLTIEAFKQALSKRDLSFRGLVDQLRHSLAIGYLRDPDLELVDVAFLLGFSEQSAFQRAFKRWTGKTPGDYRKPG